jgi:23S rRNA pseudouridine2605 synthase
MNIKTPSPKQQRKKQVSRQRPHNNLAPESKKIVTAAPKVMQTNAAGERIQKILARGGVGSRREIERWIEEGRIKVNGSVVGQGVRLKAGDYLEVNDRVVHWEKFAEQATRVLLYHKAVGEVVTRNDPEGRPVIFKNLPALETARWIAVGRLDINTSGLLLVTNNGELANRLMHPSTQIEREYAVRILGNVSDATIELLKTGVALEDGIAKFDEIHFAGGEGANKWYNVIVSEGRNRLVRRLWESQTLTVSRLIRVRYGTIVLPDGLRTSRSYELDDKELDLLFDYVGMEKEKPAVKKMTLSVPSKRRR